MAINERARLTLFEQLGTVLEPESAETLMELLPPVGWADVATKDDVHQCRDTLRTEIAALGTELRAHTDTSIASLAAELRSEMADRAGMAQLQAAIAEQGQQHRAGMAQLQVAIAEQGQQHRAAITEQGQRFRDETATFRSEVAEVSRRVEKLNDKMDKLLWTTVVTVAGFTLTVWLTILVPPLFG